jgi:type I restriction enzyme, S subunit
MKQYEKYKDSGIEWLGEIPEHWECVKFKRLAKIKNGKDQKDVMIIDGKFPVLGSGGEFGRASKCLYDKPSVLLGRKGTIDKPQYIEEPFWTVDTLFYTEIFEGVSPKFLYYSSQIIPFDYLQESSAVPSMTQEKLHNVYLCRPSLAEQIQITNYIDHQITKTNQLITEKESLISKLQEKRKALINEVVTKGIYPNAPMRDSGIEWLGTIPEHWKCFNFRYIIDILTDFTANGSFGDLAKNVTYLEEGYSRLVRLTDLRENLNNKGIYVSKKSHEYLSKSSLYGDEILLANVGAYAGLACLMPKIDYPATLGPNMFLLKFNAKVNNKFIYYALLSSYLSEQLINKAISSAQPKLNKEDVRSCIVILPSLSDQAQIVELIESRTTKIEQTILEIQIQIQKLKEYKTAVISEVVTGKVDVREWKTPNP